jgi:uncharacterized membrane protein
MKSFLLSLASLFALNFSFVSADGYMMGPYYGGMWLFGYITWILVIVALVLFIIWLVRQLQNPKGKK